MLHETDVPAIPRLPAPLARPFSVLAFDWDGTAVPDRLADATAIRLRLAELLARGVYVAIITGTNLANIERQLTAAMRPAAKRHLYICANRGSEVFGFDGRGQPRLVSARVATPQEEQQLTAIADAVAETVRSRTGLPVAVVYDRLNRRKIDLLPLPEWADPPKAQIGEMLRFLEERLVRAGLAGGIREVVALTREIAVQRGLPDARITTDVKHVEVGLTDKGDAADWVVVRLAAPRGIPARDILFVGDEFGPIAGLTGSDSRMITPLTAAATFVSVGAEPNGVPPPVLHVPGGPAAFARIVEQQIAERGAPTRAA